MRIYISSEKISEKDYLDLLVTSEPISLMGKLTDFLRSCDEVDSADSNGIINFTKNYASTHLIIFGRQRKELFNQIDWFSNQEKVFLINIVDKDSLLEKERVFSSKNKKTKNYIQSLKDDYDKHKANKDLPKMADCIIRAEDIVAGKIKIN